MKSSEAYFTRNRGEWDWKADFKITNWLGLWRSALPVVGKLRVTALILAQHVFGPFQMWTKVELENNARLVRHSTRIKQWGKVFYRSEKAFVLLEDGESLRLEGVEYYWPMLFKAVPFQPRPGVVDRSTTRARYQMPLAGVPCDCQAFLERPVGHIDIEMPWLKGRFTLTDASNAVLTSRLQQ